MKKIIVLFLCLSLIACSSNTVKEVSDEAVFIEPNDPYSYVERLKEFTPREKNAVDVQDNEEFDAFLDEYYLDILSEDYLNMHFSLEDYESLGLEKPEVTIGEINYDFVSQIEELEEVLNKLASFDFNSLSYRQQIDYEALEYSCLESMASLAYGKYPLLFDTGSSLHSNIITNFTEFVFRSEEDIEDYLVLVADIDRYLNDAIEFTKRQADEGIALQDYTLDETISYIDKFVAKVDDNELIVTFNEKIDEFEGLDEERKNELKAENERLVKEEVIASYNNVEEELLKLKGKSRLAADDAGAYEYDAGYGELVTYLRASDNSPLDELYEEVNSAMISLLTDLVLNSQDEEVYNEAIEFIFDPSSNDIINMDIYEMLEYLRTAISEDYPSIGDISYEVSLLDPSIAEDSILAYYLTAPHDNPDSNVIRINPNHLDTSSSLTYTTLAHEGFPGHLYQNAYYATVISHPIRLTQSFIGYTEGQAMFASIDAYNYLGLSSEEVASIVTFNDISFSYILEAIAEIGVNSYGWTKEELMEELELIAGLDEEMSQLLYETAVSGNSMLVPYGAGLAQFINLENSFIDSVDDYDKKEFRELILKNGPLPFVILEDVVNDYLEAR